MITIPIEGFTPQQNEELKTIAQALFIEVVDNRLISVMSEDEVVYYTKVLMEDPVCESLYDMLNIFGEEHFIIFIKPVLEVLASSDYNPDTYVSILKDKVEEIT